MKMEGTVLVVICAAMLAGTIVGQFLGMGVDAIALGRRIVWIPLVCSAVLEAIAGARIGASRLGRPLTTAECTRLTVWYSAGLAALTLPLGVWIVAAHGSAGPSLTMTSGTAAAVALVLAAAVGWTGLRGILMTLLSARART